MWDAFTGLCDTGQWFLSPPSLLCTKLTGAIGAQVQVPNIFQMTPEMLAMAASTNGFNTLTESNDYPSIAEEAPLTTGPLQSQQNISNQMYHYPSSNDPFAIPREQHGGSGLRSAATALFRDFHAGSSSSLGRGSDPASDALETPTGSRNGMDTNSIMEGGEDTAGTRAGPIELSVALPRKPRTYPALQPDGPVRARTVTYKSRGASRSETEEPSESLGSRVASFSAATHAASKRTISGQVAQASSSALINDPMAPQRRSVRLLSQVRPISSKISSSMGGIGSRDGRELKKAKATGTKGRIGLAGPSFVGRATSGHRKLFEGHESESKENQQCAGNLGERGSARPVITEEIKQREAIQYLLDLFAQMAAGLFALTRFQCTEALRIFQAINPTQRDTVWVLSQMGRAHYEETSYVEAEKVFRRIRELSPSRLDGMEIYTATLWHLRNEVELAYLAHELVDIDRLAPESWCAIGNTFSCQGEHERALRCFERATQLDPTFAYAYTHQGHEHVINEEYDQAQASYRRGIAVDERCYTAWFGLGQVYEKLGQFGEAEKHYRRATSINPSNAVLVCRIGVALEKSQRPKAALTQYSAACQLAPRSSNPRFMKARVLLQLSEPQLALTELKVLKDLVPDEANMHFLLADTYSRLRQRGNALKHYTIASTLDPTVGRPCDERSVIAEVLTLPRPARRSRRPLSG